MGDLDLIARTLEVQTPYAPQEAVSRARVAIERVGRVNLARPHIVQESDEALLVEIRPTSPIGFLADDTTFAVIAESENGSTVVTVGAVDFSVYQEKLFFVIPFGPKTVPGSAVYARCLEEIEREL